jgi:8-oxo-dGTP pyrophosphatase MutT (NUDIX family)
MITSFGIILFTIKNNKKYFLIGKRMDSLEFLDMFNSRCPIEKVEGYVANCTNFERQKLKSDNFNHIFLDSFASHRDYKELQERWKRIRPYVQQGLEKQDRLSTCMYSLPKGKKKYGETQEEAALREFEEETKIDRAQIAKAFYPSYSTVWTGSDGKVYKAIFYVYKCEDFINIEPSFRESPYLHRHYSVSEEMERLLWIPVDEIDQYLDEHMVDIVRQI